MSRSNANPYSPNRMTVLDAFRNWQDWRAKQPPFMGVDTNKPVPKTREGLIARMQEMTNNEAALEAGLDFVSPLGGFIGHTVWHGSPFRFSQPSIEKIGTGEGNQAYGHGFYSTETRDIAQGYRSPSNPLLGKHPTPEPMIDGVPIDNIPDFPKRGYWAHHAIMEKGSPDAAMQDYLATIERNYRKDWIKRFRNEEKGMTDLAETFGHSSDEGLLSKIKNLALERADETKRYIPEKDELDAIEYMKGKKLGMTEVGHLYKMDIPDAHIPYYLDWDKPLSQQTAEIQGILGKNKGVSNAERQWRETNEQLIDEFETKGHFGKSQPMTSAGREAQKKRYWRYIENLNKGFDPTGEDLYQVLMPKMIYGNNANAGNIDYAKVSEVLSEMGIKGNRYLDGNSRMMGDGTSNFVTFDPTAIKVLSRKAPTSESGILKKIIEGK